MAAGYCGYMRTTHDPATGRPVAAAANRALGGLLGGMPPEDLLERCGLLQLVCRRWGSSCQKEKFWGVNYGPAFPIRRRRSCMKPPPAR